MSCGHDHCACDHPTDTPDTGHDRQLPTVDDKRPAEGASGCCGGNRHADRAEASPDPAH